MKIDLTPIQTKYNLTFAEVAKKAGMKASHISKIQHGYFSPTLKTLNRIADAVPCDVREFIKEA